MRWQLYDPVAVQTYVFPHSPKTMTSMAQPHVTKSVAASPINGKVRGFRTQNVPFAWSFTGKVRTKAEYDALDQWATRPNHLHLTDHFGRVHDVLMRQFLPTPVQNGEGNPWLFTYQVDCLYCRRIS